MKKKILIVEDNERNRTLFRDILKYFGYEILEAGDGSEGINIARAQMPDLILMDIQMPVMDGESACRIIKNDPACKGIKIIAVTSFAMKGDKEKLLDAGFDYYIAKPVDTRDLPLSVERLLSE